MLLTNARIYTMDAGGSVADTLVVREGRVAYAGRRGDVNPAPGEPVLDLGGRAVLPGLVDGHAHLMHLARARLSLDATGLRSETAVAERVAAAAERTPAGEWLSGRGWDQNLWPGKAFPDRGSLDRAAPRHPVALTRVDGHATWVNAAALAAAGITRHTPDPDGGIIARDRAGEPAGLLIDAAQRLVHAVIPHASEERFDQAVRDSIAECLAKGLTGIHEMGADRWALAAYRRLIARGQFPFRNYAALGLRSATAWDEATEWARPEPASDRGNDGHLVVGAVKLWLDGALGSRGAALHSPYCDDPGNSGLLLVPPDELARVTSEAAGRGFQVCVHAIGDRANSLALDAFERAFAGVRDHRARVEHAQILSERDVGRFRGLGVLPSMQATHCTSDMEWAEERLGPERLRFAYAWRSLLATGALIAGGSDFPVEDANPFLGLSASVTRRPPGGPDRGWQPEQRMTREEAVRSFTVWNAHAAFQERELGALEVGKRADLIALSEDVFACPEARIAGIRPVLTMVGGEIAFRAPPG